MGCMWRSIGCTWRCVGWIWRQTGCTRGSMGCTWRSIGCTQSYMGCAQWDSHGPVPPPRCRLVINGAVCGSAGMEEGTPTAPRHESPGRQIGAVTTGTERGRDFPAEMMRRRKSLQKKKKRKKNQKEKKKKRGEAVTKQQKLCKAPWGSAGEGRHVLRCPRPYTSPPPPAVGVVAMGRCSR